jgi:hypothetical protein
MVHAYRHDPFRSTPANALSQVAFSVIFLKNQVPRRIESAALRGPF